MEKRGPSCTVGGVVNWCRHCGKQHGGPPQIKNRLPYGPEFPLLGIYPKKPETLIQKGVCTPVFTAALLTVTKMWKQPKHPTRDKRIKKLWGIYIHIHIMEYYSTIKKNEVLLLATAWMDLEGYMSDRKRKGQIP